MIDEDYWQEELELIKHYESLEMYEQCDALWKIIAGKKTETEEKLK